jgi:hypothetical protein
VSVAPLGLGLLVGGKNLQLRRCLFSISRERESTYARKHVGASLSIAGVGARFDVSQGHRSLPQESDEMAEFQDPMVSHLVAKHISFALLRPTKTCRKNAVCLLIHDKRITS